MIWAGRCSMRCSGILLPMVEGRQWHDRRCQIINAPSSTKNADKARDPEMHQTKKENQWYFGMKPHFGVDSRRKLIHAVVATTANVADSTVLPQLFARQRDPPVG
jgi:IS5 family transposase